MRPAVDHHARVPAWARPATRLLGRAFRRGQHRLRCAFSRVHPAPVFVLGNQKSGTSAIAALLARACDLSVSVDMLMETRRPLFQRVLKGEIPFERYLRANRWEFSHEVVKEPNLTLLHPQLALRFPSSPFVFVLRDPRDNLRSLLNNLAIPGDLPALEPDRLARMGAGWKLVLDGRWLGIEGDHYIDQLAGRWVRFARIYQDNAHSMHLCRYEDFLADKLGVLAGLAAKIGHPVVRDVSEELDWPFQSVGDRTVAWTAFFGAANLARIERICGEAMCALGYPRAT